MAKREGSPLWLAWGQEQRGAKEPRLGVDGVDMLDAAKVEKVHREVELRVLGKSVVLGVGVWRSALWSQKKEGSAMPAGLLGVFLRDRSTSPSPRVSGSAKPIYCPHVKHRLCFFKPLYLSSSWVHY